MACAVTDERETVNRLLEEIKNLPSDDPSLCESQIRVLHENILAINSREKEQLLTELKKISYKGLSPELCEMVKKKVFAHGKLSPSCESSDEEKRTCKIFV